MGQSTIRLSKENIRVLKQWQKQKGFKTIDQFVSEWIKQVKMKKRYSFYLSLNFPGKKLKSLENVRVRKGVYKI